MVVLLAVPMVAVLIMAAAVAVLVMVAVVMAEAVLMVCVPAQRCRYCEEICMCRNLGGNHQPCLRTRRCRYWTACTKPTYLPRRRACALSIRPRDRFPL